MTGIDDVFSQIEPELSIGDTIPINTIKVVVEEWANAIIEKIMDKNLYPELQAQTIHNRMLRDINLIGSDYPLLETGEWVSFIEFRITRENDGYKVETGVWENNTLIGHTRDRTPEDIAYMNEYGWDESAIPARNLFTITQMEIEERLNSILQLSETDYFTDKETLIGHLVADGASLKLVWVEE